MAVIGVSYADVVGMLTLLASAGGGLAVAEEVTEDTTDESADAGGGHDGAGGGGWGGGGPHTLGKHFSSPTWVTLLFVSYVPLSLL